MTRDPLEYPRLRPIEAFPAEMEGKRVICLRDPAEVAPNVLALSLALIEVVSNFDGEHSLSDIQETFLERTGQDLPKDKLEEIVKMLDAGLFLEGPRFEAEKKRVAEEFIKSPQRPAFHAGGAYPKDPVHLKAKLNGFTNAEGGPGATSFEDRGPVKGLVAPHIDFNRGGPAYAWAYRDLPERTDAETFVVFGTCHAGMETRFGLTKKAYDTPLGPLEVDANLARELQNRFSEDLYRSESAHRVEHSIEFQAVWLKHLFAGKRDIRVLPVLTSFCHELASLGQTPVQDAHVTKFFEALEGAIQATGRKVCFIAGADLAHVGPRFGDPKPVDAERLAEVERQDRVMLLTAEQSDPEAFFRSISLDGDQRRICGWSPIYSLLRAVRGAKGRLHRYAQWPDPDGTVTFASMSFH